MPRSNSKRSKSRSVETRKDSLKNKSKKHRRSKHSSRRSISRSRSKSRSYSRSPSPYTKSRKSKKSAKGSSSRSRSRSRSKSRSRSQDKKSSSYHRNRDGNRSSERHRDKSPREERGGGRFKDIPDHVRNPRRRQTEDPTQPKRRLGVNNFALAGFIMDTKKTNERLDKQEVQEANVSFKRIDHSDRTAKLMSAHLNSKNENRDEYVMEYINGEYVKVVKQFQCAYQECNIRFRFAAELDEHLKSHQKEEAGQNKKRADDFLKSF